jgi:ParB family chromosome partitioning protein
MAKPVLGRGLSALLGGKPSGSAASAPGVSGGSAAPVPPVDPAAAVIPAGPPTPRPAERVAVDRIRPSSLQPRREFPAGTLQELADSIREQGILQPLVVRPRGGHLELIAGERRWRAAQLAGLTDVPVVVREADDTTALELMLVENLQREDLNPVDEAQGYHELIERFQLTQDAVATRVGRSRASVANALRLLKLPSPVQGLLREGRLSTGHAKVLLGLSDSDRQSHAAERVVSEGLSVRQSEELVARLSVPVAAPEAAAASAASQQTAASVAAAVAVRDPHVASMEDRLRQRLGTKVNLRYKQGRGQIDIRFFSDDELERVLEILGVSNE